MQIVALIVVVVAFSQLLGLGLVSAVIAARKGYRPWFWPLSLGPVGFVLILMKPALRRATTPEEREHWESSADWTGGVLSAVTFLGVLLPAMFLMVSFLSLSAAPVAPAPRPVPIRSGSFEPSDASQGATLNTPATDLERKPEASSSDSL